MVQRSETKSDLPKKTVGKQRIVRKHKMELVQRMRAHAYDSLEILTGEQ